MGEAMRTATLDVLPWDHHRQVWRIRTENGTGAFFDFTGPTALYRREPMRHESGRINTLGEPPRWSVLGYGPWGRLDDRTLDEPPSLGLSMIYGRTPRDALRSTTVVDIRLAGDDVPPCDLPSIENRGLFDPADSTSGWMVVAGAELEGLRVNAPTREGAVLSFATDLGQHLDMLMCGYPRSRVGRWWAARIDEYGNLHRFLSEHLEVEAEHG